LDGINQTNSGIETYFNIKLKLLFTVV